jgi:hypothetical protein
MARPQIAAASPVTTKPPTMVAGIIEVRAKFPPFVDQVEAVTIGANFQPVKWHEHLQAQIDAGWLIQR